MQEAAAKWPALRAANPDLRLHMIGRLQSNKAAEAVDLFDTIHSLDRPSLLDALAAAAAKADRFPTCFVQVNVGKEEQKGGVALADLDRCSSASGLATALPVMCIPPAAVARPFCAFPRWLAAITSRPVHGMIADYETESCSAPPTSGSERLFD